MATTKQTNSIHLSASDPDRQVVITPEDEDRFSLTCAQAIEACKVHTSRKIWFDELASMFGHVQEWVKGHEGLIHACYAVPRGGQVVVFIVPSSDSFDFTLADSLADLSLEIYQKFQLIPTEVLQIPGKDDEHLQTFFNRKTAKALHVTRV